MERQHIFAITFLILFVGLIMFAAYYDDKLMNERELKVANEFGIGIDQIDCNYNSGIYDCYITNENGIIIDTVSVI